MNLVRGTSRLIPEEAQGQPGDEAGERWWQSDRHHGMGDLRWATATEDTACSQFTWLAVTRDAGGHGHRLLHDSPQEVLKEQP